MRPRVQPVQLRQAGERMKDVVNSEFDEAWLRDYERRTGLKVRDPGRKPVPEPPKARRSKYNNRKTERDGRIFDSLHEAECYDVLKLRLQAGEIRGFVCQQPFVLPGGVRYYADFVVLRNDGRYDVLDAKSDATRKDKAYRIKARQMREVLGIEIVEV